MKRFLVSILVPASAAIAVVGSGFSVWYFGDKEVSNTTSATLKFENLLQVGSFTSKTGTVQLSFDQTKSVRDLIVGQSDELSGLEANGISFTGDTTVTYNVPTPADVVDQGKFGEVTVKTEIKTVITIKDTLADWLTVKGKTESDKVTGNAGVYTYVWADSTATTRTLDLANVLSFEYAPIANQYETTEGKVTDRKSATTCEPMNAAEYRTMKNVLTADKMNENITLVTTATLVKVNA